MKELIYHKFRNSSIGGYFIRNGADASEPIGMDSASAEIRGWLDEVISSSRTGIVKVSFEDDEKSKKEQGCGQDESIMIPVHDWIWQDFKKAYSARNKTKFETDKELIEVVHDWACRAMQYYIHEGIEDPWTIMEAYKIAMECPDIHIKRERGVWVIETAHMFDVETKDASELLRKVRAAREYIEASVPQHRTTRDIVREAYAIAETCPALIIEELRDGWFIYLKDEEYPGDYSVKAKDAEQLLRETKMAKECYEAAMESREKYGKDNEEPCKHPTVKEVIDEAETIAKSVPGMTVEALTCGNEIILWDIRLEGEDYRGTAKDAEQLLRAVKGAKAFWEALQDLEKKEQADAVRLDEDEEEGPAQDEDGVIRIDKLDHSIKRLLLHFIENLTIKQAMEILEVGNYPHIALDKLYDLSIDLRLSVEKEEW